MNYKQKELAMVGFLRDYIAPAGFRSTIKGAPMSMYEEAKQYIDFTKYFVMFRGPRPNFGQCSTRKRDARAFDIYKRDDRTTNSIRAEREGFWNGVRWANNRSH